MEIRVWRRSANIVQTLDLEVYLTHVLPNEIFASWPEETLKANAILARSYAFYYINNPNTLLLALM
jgi:stage II sporulation protein D